MEVDFGDVGYLYDPVTKKKRKAWVFSGRLNYSRIAWREIVFDQKQDTFFQCHIHAFDFFGGVPKVVVPDNLKAAVIKSSHEDPLVNRAYRSLARHYGFRIDPCLPYTPQHKGGVENDVRYIKNNFFPIFRETQSSMGRDLPSIVDANKGLIKWGDDIAHPRVIRDLGCRPIDLLDTEKSKLSPLPSQTWDQESWTEHKVSRDWRFRHECSKYSVPCELITKSVIVCTTTKLVRVFYEGKEVTVHSRATEKNKDIWKESHAPVHKQAYMNVTRESLHQQAVSIGPETGKTVRLILDRPEVDGLRPARKLVALKDKYGSSRLEAACKRANEFETSSYGSVKNILTKELDRNESAPQLQRVEVRSNQNYRFARIFMLFSGLTLTISTQGEKLWMTLSF
jgi:transposase